MSKRFGPAVLLPLALALLAQSDSPGPRVLTFRSNVDDSDQPYALYLPQSFNPARKYPLVIGLHEEDSNHVVNLKRLVPRDADFIVACPYARGVMGYQGLAEKDVYDVLADVKRRFPIEEDRVYLTGASMGGGGALWLALTRPDVWAAVAPVCAAVIPGSDELAPNALNLPIRLFHGDQDPAVSVESSRAWQRRLLNLGAPADYIEYPGVRHNAWDFAYKGGAIFDWFAKFRRGAFGAPYPERVRFVTRSYRYNSAYWVRIDGLTPGVPASIDATWTSQTDLRIETQNLDGFTLALNRPAAVVTIDGAVLRMKAAAQLSFTRSSGHWLPGLLAPSGKRPGAEGPIAEAVAARHIYVYGTTGARTAEELDARRKIAETAARWSTRRWRLNLALPVKADTAVTPEDLDTADLVLFGARETNSLIARFAGRLPLALNAGAADYGLLFVAPVGPHYLLVSSGLPWWTGADDANRGGYRYAPDQYRLLRTFGDYILFKGALANVVAEGRFDGNWKLPADASARMLATGTVTIH